MRYNIIIGIDPDIDKNGVAYLMPSSRKIETYKYTLSELVDAIIKTRDTCKLTNETMCVIVEGGFTIKTNWHLDNLMRSNNLSMASRLRLAASIGRSQGENAQRGRDIFELVKSLHVPCFVQKPYVHDWGKDHRSKISKAELDYVVGYKMKRNNQEERDAALIAWLGANFPLRRSANVLKGL